jgi:hypothetical protein
VIKFTFINVKCLTCFPSTSTKHVSFEKLYQKHAFRAKQSTDHILHVDTLLAFERHHVHKDFNNKNGYDPLFLHVLDKTLFIQIYQHCNNPIYVFRLHLPTYVHCAHMNDTYCNNCFLFYNEAQQILSLSADVLSSTTDNLITFM